jgi:hypothetical protein
VLLVDAAHERSSGRQDLIDEDEDGLLWRELDPLPDDVYELTDSQVGWDKILLLVNGRNVALLNLLADDLNSDGLLAW